MRANREYRAAARESLEGKWPEAVVGSVIVIAIIMACNGINIIGQHFNHMAYLQGSFTGLGSIANILIAFPLAMALQAAFLRLIRGNSHVASNSILITLGDYFRYVAAALITRVIIVAAGVCSFFLLCALGFYFAMAYAMVPYLLEDYPDMTWREAMSTSRRMMDGHKMELFMLNLSFIGWALLCCLTFGIGFFFLSPYIWTTIAHYYEDLRAERLELDGDDAREVFRQYGEPEEAEVVE